MTKQYDLIIIGTGTTAAGGLLIHLLDSPTVSAAQRTPPLLQRHGSAFATLCQGSRGAKDCKTSDQCQFNQVVRVFVLSN